MAAISLVLGAGGLVPGFANVHPRLLSDLYAAVQKGASGGGVRDPEAGGCLPADKGRASLHGTKLLAAHLGPDRGDSYRAAAAHDP